MAVELQSLIEKVSDKDLELVAGKEGMNHLVTWVHMVETVDATTFLEGNEVAVSTGIGLTKDEDFLMLIKALVEHNAAAILINIGPYVSQIPQSVIDCCCDFLSKSGRPLYYSALPSEFFVIMGVLRHMHPCDF